MISWVGRTLSKVEIQELVAQGGMAELYLGRHTTLDRPRAVKILHAHLTENETLLGRFMDEAKSVAGLRHPNIVQVFDYDVANGSPYIVMEFIKGVSLSDYLKALREAGRKLPQKTVARIVEQLAGALDYAHDSRIVHRDVKPSNVMLRWESWPIDAYERFPDDAEPVLTDFGVARLADMTARTASGDIIGTPAYMSPEQVRGEVVDLRSDIYSLGVMLYEMLAGRAPFDPETETTASILVKHMTEAPPPLPNTSSDLQVVLDRALAKDPGQRFQRAGDLAASLNIALERGELPSLATDDIEQTLATASLPQAAVPVPQPSQAPMPTPSSGLRLPLIIGGIVVLGGLAAAVVVGALVLRGIQGGGQGEEAPVAGEGGEAPLDADVPTPPPPVDGEPGALSDGQAAQPDAGSASGVVLFRDDTLRLNITGLAPAPDGFVYQVWLTGAEVNPLNVGSPDVSDGQFTFEFANPSGEHITNQFGACVVSLEPAGDDDPAISADIALEAQIPTDTLQRIRLLDDVSRGQALQDAVLNGLPFQTQQYISHQGFAIDAIAGGNKGGADLHSEHVVNIIEGREGSSYGSWDGNERIENPGDDVGLLPYLLILDDAAQAAASAPDASDETIALANSISTSVGELVPLAEAASRNAQRVASADSIEEIEELVPEIQSIRDQMRLSVDTLVLDAGSLELAIGAEIVAAGG